MEFILASKEVVIVSDIRRQNDIKYFEENYGKKVHKIRLTCPDAIRIQRNWSYTVGVDDVESECGLDNYSKWDMILENNGQINGDSLVEAIVKKFNLE